MLGEIRLADHSDQSLVLDDGKAADSRFDHDVDYLAGVRVGVVSNWSPALGGLLEGLGLLRHLDPVVCSALERVEKPDPAIFLLALRRAGLPAAQALHAGDHPDKDVAAARSAGLESVLVDHDGGGAAGEAVGSLPELAELVLARDP